MGTKATSGGEVVRFEARSEAEALVHLRARCDDGRYWILTVVFGSCTAYPHRTRRFPRELVSGAARAIGEAPRYWHRGAWHEIPAARVAEVERREWEEADAAMGVSDGGGITSRRDLVRWINGITRKANARAARLQARAAELRRRGGAA